MSNRLLRFRRGLLRRADEFLRTSPLLAPWRVDRAADAAELRGEFLTGWRTIAPAQARVSLEPDALDAEFLRIGRHYRDGGYARGEVFTCEVPEALCHIGTGIVCARDFTAIHESQMKYRMTAGPAAVGNRIQRPFRWFKPLRVPRLPGLHATIGNVYMSYWGHWIFDCLPRLYSLEKAAEGRPVTLLVPDGLPASFRDSLACVLPANFTVEAHPGNRWVRVERMLLASHATGYANHHMPREFYDFVRQACFRKFGLPAENQPSRRLYVSRAATRHRRIRNEKELAGLLAGYGFETVALEKRSFREQVELFHRAAIIVAADGSNWANMIFAGPIPVFVLYATRSPSTHWFTAAKGLGQRHHFLAADEESPHSDFTVDLKEVERVLTEQMGLRRAA